MPYELKSSWASVSNKDVQDFMALAKRLRPDRMLLAVKEDGRHLMVQLQAAKEALAAEGIKFELLTPMEYSTNGDPLLRAEA